MKRVLLTGATGFVGANLTRHLLLDGHDISLLVRPGHQTWRIEDIRSHIQLHQVDMRDVGSLEKVVADIRPEWIFHLAASGAYSWQTDIQQMIATNIVSTANLLQVCQRHGFEAFVNAGSSSEYGYKDHAPSEDEWLEPNSYYAVTKASATLLCRHTARNKNLHIPTLRLYSVYGPFEDPQRLMPSVVVNGVDGKLPPLANPDIARDFVYTSDVNNAFFLAASVPDQEPGAVYNVGTGVQTSLREVIDIARKVMNISTEPDWGSMADRKWDTNIWVADNSTIRRALGWNPKITLEDGLQSMVDWFKDNPNYLEHYLETHRRG